MLNRRSLRIKVAQSLYAYQQLKQANLELARDEVVDRFSLKFDTPEEVSEEQLAPQRKEALQLFDTAHQSGNEEINHEHAEIKEAVQDALLHFENQLKDDVKRLRKNLVTEAENVENRYFLILDLLLSFARLATGDSFKKPEKYSIQNLIDNRVVKALSDNEEVQSQISKRKISWQKDWDSVVTWYKEIVIADDEVQAYKGIDNPDLEQDKVFLNYIVKTLIFKNEDIGSFFEALDLNWDENKQALRSMVSKTVKSVEESDGNFSVEISPLSYNWEDDKTFFDTLFVKSIQGEEEFDELVAEKSKNWDIHRLAVMDKIILKMAICEMINFPSIPVKVTINEYIEISKRYSTPKSKQFVNGLLDGLANKLVADGVIKKSGRGLIDNK